MPMAPMREQMMGQVQVGAAQPVANPERLGLPVEGGGKQMLIPAMHHLALLGSLIKIGFGPMGTDNQHHKHQRRQHLAQQVS
ncbi:hypothetical protein D3C76_1480920 [compost metagenome]